MMINNIILICIQKSVSMIFLKKITFFDLIWPQVTFKKFFCQNFMAYIHQWYIMSIHLSFSYMTSFWPQLTYVDLYPLQHPDVLHNYLAFISVEKILRGIDIKGIVTSYIWKIKGVFLFDRKLNDELFLVSLFVY